MLALFSPTIWPSSLIIFSFRSFKADKLLLAISGDRSCLISRRRFSDGVAATGEAAGGGACAGGG